MKMVLSRMHPTPHSGGKAKFDVRDILVAAAGFAAVTMDDSGSRRQKVIRSLREAPHVLRAVRRLEPDDVLVWQYPMGPVGDFIARYGARSLLIGFVHDLETLRQGQEPLRDARALRRCDVVVAHNDAMASWLRRILPSSVPLVTLGVFDYLSSASPALPASSDKPRTLYLVGSLAPSKIAWLSQVGPTRVPIKAYGPSFDAKALGGVLDWQGMLDVDSPRLPRRDGFGIVWDGDFPDSLSQPVGNYLKYNSPHKMSCYLALGLPVIVPRESALAPFVLAHDIGYAVESVAEGANRVADCEEASWNRKIENVNNLRKLVLSGHFTRTAVVSAERAARVS